MPSLYFTNLYNLLNFWNFKTNAWLYEIIHNWLKLALYFFSQVFVLWGKKLTKKIKKHVIFVFFSSWTFSSKRPFVWPCPKPFWPYRDFSRCCHAWPTSCVFSCSVSHTKPDVHTPTGRFMLDRVILQRWEEFLFTSLLQLSRRLPHCTRLKGLWGDKPGTNAGQSPKSRQGNLSGLVIVLCLYTTHEELHRTTSAAAKAEDIKKKKKNTPGSVMLICRTLKLDS